MSQPDELYVLARRVLLDALAALGAHRDATILVGAQAVYLRVGEGDLAVAPYTTDGDLALDPAVLADFPPLQEALERASFVPGGRDSVGVWTTSRPTSLNPAVRVSIDLLVPQAVSPGQGRRAAHLPGHHPSAARIVRGLEGVLVDADVMPLTSLDPQDPRAFAIRVAGPAALLVAKVHKIRDRSGSARGSDKDALDVLRLLRGTQTPELARRFGLLLGDARSGEVAAEGRELLRSQFGVRGGAGVQMATRAAGVLADSGEITASCEILTGDLVASLSGAP